MSSVNAVSAWQALESPVERTNRHLEEIVNVWNRKRRRVIFLVVEDLAS